jgi:AraC family transcriptional regulator
MHATAAEDLRGYADTYAASYCHTIIVSERVGTAGAALLSFRCPAGRYRSEPTSDFALTMLQNGGFAAELDLGRGKFSASVAPGQLFLAPPFTATENAFDDSATGTVMALQHGQVAELLHDMPQQPQALLQNLYTRTFYDDFIRVAINQLVALTRSRRESDRLFADGVIVAIFAALVRHCTRRSGCARRGLADWQMRRVMEQLNSMQNVSLADLATSANLSPFYFARAFKETTGLPPHQFHQRLRMERAKELLRTTQLSVTDIALRVGYGSSQTLARVFRKNGGSTPAGFRRSTAV